MAWQSDLNAQIRRAQMLRARLAEQAGAIARTEEAVARIHDELAEQDPRHSAEYRRTADAARVAARRAWDLQREVTGWTLD